MSNFSLKSLDIKNFRSIRGHVHAPLDAKVVLIHGENGAGKTSFLSAVELALTGKIQALERADFNYKKQLLHRSAPEGSVLLKTLEGTLEASYEARLNLSGAQSLNALDEQRATFFRERAFLPQSLLSQLLQIYQGAGNDATSPLAQFVGKLLGLDRLDALEAGLQPLTDVRNVRKITEGWLTAENEKLRLDRLLKDQRQLRHSLNEQIRYELQELTLLCTSLELSIVPHEDALEVTAAAFSEAGDAEDFARLTDERRKLASIRREIDAAQKAIGLHPVANLIGPAEASDAFSNWEVEYGERTGMLRNRVEVLLPDVSFPSSPEQFADAALAQLNAEQIQLFKRVSKAREEIGRHSTAQDERDVALRQLSMLEEEISHLPNDAGSLGSALAELTSYISNDNCPVCDRDFGETSGSSLAEHVHNKIRTLSASAERLITLGRTRGEIQVAIERLNREIDSLAVRRVDAEVLANLDRRLALVATSINELDSVIGAFREGGRLRAADVAARRALTAVESYHVSIAAARGTLSDFALMIGAPTPEEGESFDAAATRMEELLTNRAMHLEERLLMKRKGTNYISAIQSARSRRQSTDSQIAEDYASWQRANQSLEKAQILRDAGNEIRTTVDKVRSVIIRREFNERLNRVWRDLFVRLAPIEPFVPAFRIPESATHKLVPKLITEHREGGDTGGTPGAMLSAGNLNTAALTLFIALHLSVPEELPWLILDDPVQSMDDVHIAHFAALLKTLSKEHGRQIMIAVHDRQLFEYLKLELSPAFPDDSLLTIELSRGPRRDSTCISKRISFKQETALRVA
ncbi:MAG: AAA family ATPase [Pseudomonadota bacterium]